jgi:hypothetical protein
MRSETSCSNHLHSPKAPPQNTAALGTKLSTHELLGGTFKIQTIVLPKPHSAFEILTFKFQREGFLVNFGSKTLLNPAVVGRARQRWQLLLLSNGGRKERQSLEAVEWAGIPWVFSNNSLLHCLTCKPSAVLPWGDLLCAGIRTFIDLYSQVG